MTDTIFTTEQVEYLVKTFILAGATQQRRNTGGANVTSPAVAAAAKTGKVGKKTNRLSEEEFVLQAITALRDETKSKGIHTVFSGFNGAFRSYFPESDPSEVTKRMAEEGLLDLVPVVGTGRVMENGKRAGGGVRIYLPGEAPQGSPKSDAETLAKILGARQ